MTTGIDARLERIGTDGSYVIIPMDHGITMGAVTGLKDIESTIDGVTTGGADAVLTQKGIAPAFTTTRTERATSFTSTARRRSGPTSRTNG